MFIPNRWKMYINYTWFINDDCDYNLYIDGTQVLFSAEQGSFDFYFEVLNIIVESIYFHFSNPSYTPICDIKCHTTFSVINGFMWLLLVGRRLLTRFDNYRPWTLNMSERFALILSNTNLILSKKVLQEKQKLRLIFKLIYLSTSFYIIQSKIQLYFDMSFWKIIYI